MEGEKETGEGNKSGKRGKTGKQEKKVSLLELNEKAQGRIDEIRRANALKSQQKIKELTAQHAMLKKDKEAKKKTEAKAPSVVDDDVEMEESKSEPIKNGHKNGKKREPLEG